MKLSQYAELKDDPNINVVVLSERSTQNSSGFMRTAGRIKEECDKRKINCYIVYVNEGTFISDRDINDDQIIIRNFNNIDQVLKLFPEDTAVIVRGGSITNGNGLSLITYLMEKNVFMINNKKSIELCSNKYSTNLKLLHNGINVPQSTLIYNTNSVDEVINKMQIQFPVIVKTLRGSRGIGVIKVDSRQSLIGILQVLWKQKQELIIQEFLNADFDVRTIVLGGKIVASMKRYKIPGDFRSNFSLGSKIEKYQLSPQEQKIVLKAAKLSGCIYCGVDHIVVNNIPYILEINSSPFSEGIETANPNINVIGELINFISNKTNWTIFSKS
jgi:ribosomal protein S6--L-glutamate ligase